MTSTMLNPGAPQVGAGEPADAAVARDAGLVGRVVVSWTVGGGLLLGGFLVAGMTLAGRLSGNALLMTAAVLYVAGAVLGFAHGAVLALLGRPSGMPARQAPARIGLAALYAIPAVAVGFLPAGWIAMTTLALYLDRTLPLIGVAAGWAAGGGLVLWAALNGVRALRNAYARWADRRLGTVLVAGTFAALLVLFLADRPALWGTPFRVTEVGAVLLAALGAFWVAGPLVTTALLLARRLPWPVLGLERAPRAVASIMIGLAAGVVLGVLAVPFQKAAFATVAIGPLGSIVHAVSRALVDEVLLRLVLVTGTVWALVRWQGIAGPRAAIAAVVIAALVQAGLYAPGVRAIGFASSAEAAAYLTVTVLLPALVFGALYWRRGFATALLAHATALVAVMLMI